MYVNPVGVVWLRAKCSSGFCHVSVKQRKSTLLSMINSLRMEPLLVRERVLKRANQRSGWFWVGWLDLASVCSARAVCCDDVGWKR